MKCPSCGENTPDAWEQLRGGVGKSFRAELATDIAPSDEGEVSKLWGWLTLDYMWCANTECVQLVVRAHDTRTEIRPMGGTHVPEQVTETWVVYPRRRSRHVDSLVPDGLRRDFDEAVAVLDESHRMSAVLARSILADLLETYASLTDFKLSTRVDKFIADEHRPFDVRQDLHYLREIANLSAHTKTNDQFERIEITRDEAEWTLTIIERLFDYFIVAPAKSEALRKGIDAKLQAAGRTPIRPLTPEQDDPWREVGRKQQTEQTPKGLTVPVRTHGEIFDNLK